MAKKPDEFDGLTFYIYVMALLTVIVGGFAAWNWKKVDKKAKEIKIELNKLKSMEEIALDPEFRGWVAREREAAGTGGGNRTDFEALIHNLTMRGGLNVTSRNSQGARTVGGGQELTWRITVEDCRLEALVPVLLQIEEQWPGARISQIVKLDFDTRSQLWDAVVDASIFKAST